MYSRLRANPSRRKLRENDKLSDQVDGVTVGGAALLDPKGISLFLRPS